MDLHLAARRLGAALEPFVGSVFFAPEVHAAYEAVGFDPSPGLFNGVAAPEMCAYFTSRGSLMGDVPGEVVAATFAVFRPQMVVDAVTAGRTRIAMPALRVIRHDAAVAALRRILGARPDGVDVVRDLLGRAAATLRPEGRALYAGVLAVPLDDDPLATAWQLGEQLREFRGDAHTAAWTAAGFDATEIGILTELYWGLRPYTYTRTRGWTPAEHEAAIDRLRTRGLVDGDAFTDAGRTAREAVEEATDRQVRPALDALGADLDHLLDVLGRWSAAVRAAGCYPATGPHEPAVQARSTPLL
ncbi:MAG: hypothetical protein FJW83_03580 [Actinobacteria bacterium]|nr:hypothetical protein [Actinomycetota bacterium]